jgi:5-methylcytosine-specific restriction enzyme A
MMSLRPPIAAFTPDKGDPARHWYITQAWQQLREFVFVRDNFRCAECKKVITDRAKLVCYHKRPHEEQAALFWEPTNLITVCADCH